MPAQSQGIVTLTINTSSEIERKISSFAALARGWDYGRGGPISQDVLDCAFEWNRFFRKRGFLETDAFPGGDGEVVIAAGCGVHDIEIIIEPDEKISIAYDCGGQHKLYQPNLAPIEATWVVTNLIGQICSASGFFTPINLTSAAKNLSSQHSVTQKTMVASQSLAWSVSTGLELPYANTFPHSGEAPQEPEYPELSGFRLFFGNLNPPYFLATR